MSKSINPDARDSVLQRYSRALLHMRQQKGEGRFGLALGSGTSTDLGFPQWGELIDRIAQHPRVGGHALGPVPGGHTSRSQLLYQHFRARLAAAKRPNSRFNRFETEVNRAWREIVHECLYREVPEGVAELEARDRYLWALLPVIRETRLTINYNFDDSVQRFILASRSDREKRKTRGYTTVSSPDLQMVPRSGVIYHPNGFLPRDLKERPSEHLVFLEDTFADQLIHSMQGHYAALAYHFAQSTRLLVGLSLSDATLRHILRQGAHIHPGHYHYYVAYRRDGSDEDRVRDSATADANFYTYNLITLFLTADEIAALGDLLSMEDAEFRDLLEQNGCATKQIFLITGAVGVGKSTSVSHFRSLKTMDEWLEQRRTGMDKDPSTLPPLTIEEIDRWVAQQWGLKNLNLIDAPSGIYVVDRAPLDAFAFTPEDQWQAKAALLKAGVAPRQAKQRRLHDAHVIFLVGNPDILSVRSVARHRDWSSKQIAQQQKLLRAAYCGRGPGVTVIDTQDKTIPQVIREVASVIFRSERYVPAPLHTWLEGFEEHGYDR
jgi:hypothetical protein